MSSLVNDSQTPSWVSIPDDSDFPVQNLPFGIFRTAGLAPRAGVAIGEEVADLQALADLNFLDGLDIDPAVFGRADLNQLIGQGRKKTRALRQRLSAIFDARPNKWNGRSLASSFLHRQTEVEMLMPVTVGDYTDFYSSLEHATNVGLMFRGKEQALMPNWRHLPVAYHGRASSIVISGTPVRRPCGQQLRAGETSPRFGPSRELDFELEMAFVIGCPSQLGRPVRIDDAEDYIFGLLLFNDWSARDIQRWEYRPLGPFLGKNFASTVSPWIVTLEALEPFRVAGPRQEPPPLPYLQDSGDHHYDIELEVLLQPEKGARQTICRSNTRNLYWNMRQQLAHHTSNGCNVKIGDLMASGTISGTEPESYGSLLERSWGGTRPLRLPDGSERNYLHDGDTVTLRAWGQRGDLRVGFGEASSRILAASEE